MLLLHNVLIFVERVVKSSLEIWFHVAEVSAVEGVITEKMIVGRVVAKGIVIKGVVAKRIVTKGLVVKRIIVESCGKNVVVGLGELFEVAVMKRGPLLCVPVE